MGANYLDTLARAHAAHLGALTKKEFPKRIRQAGNPQSDGSYKKPPLTQEHRKFINDVRNANRVNGIGMRRAVIAIVGEPVCVHVDRSGRREQLHVARQSQLAAG